jgi:orotidine-5'-phosphate decarboxylase
VRAIRDKGCEVFLDLKVNDIPNQAAGAVRAAARIGARYLTVHANAGRDTLRAAVEAASGGLPRILVVSVVTSLDTPGLRELGVGRDVSDQVDAMAELAVAERAPGLVLAATEVARVRGAHPDLFLVTPGIRPAGTKDGDQRRTGTPAAAVTAGADMLVVGRPVYAAPDPRAALEAILAEIDDARSRVV